jgi:hypothetical protein
MRFARELERPAPDAARLGSERSERARPDRGQERRLPDPRARVAADDDAERPRRIVRDEHLAFAAFELPDPVAADEGDAGGRVEIRYEWSERERPALRAGDDPCEQLVR